MKKETARRIADQLTWARIWSAIPITIAAWLGLKWWVFGLYAAAALTLVWHLATCTRPGRESELAG